MSVPIQIILTPLFRCLYTQVIGHAITLLTHYLFTYRLFANQENSVTRIAL